MYSNLTEHQNAILLHVIENPGVLASKISSNLDIEKTVVYRAVNVLSDLEMLQKIGENRSIRLFPREKEFYAKQLEDQKRLVIEKEKELDQLFNNSKLKPNINSRIETFSGNDAVYKIKKAWLKYGAKEIISIHSDNKNILPQRPKMDFWSDYIDRRVKLGIKTKIITSRNSKLDHNQITNLEKLKEVRRVNTIDYFDTEIAVFGDSISFYNTSSPIFLGIIIKDKSISNTYRKILENLWLQGQTV